MLFNFPRILGRHSTFSHKIQQKYYTKKEEMASIFKPIVNFQKTRAKFKGQLFLVTKK